MVKMDLNLILHILQFFFILKLGKITKPLTENNIQPPSISDLYS